jgi:Family of unknown function (DUF5996)
MQMEQMGAPMAVDRQRAAASRDASPWPALPLAEWSDTRDTLHRWTQVVGKIRMAVEPPLNHWWHVPLYVSSRGLTTSLIHHRTVPFEMTFDFTRDQLSIEVIDGRVAAVGLYPRSVADFYDNVTGALQQLHLPVDIYPRPVEVEDGIPFSEDTVHASYDPLMARTFWRSLIETHRVLSTYSGRFRGKNSPVHFFWGSFDLAQTRFSGRTAPPYPGGGVPNVPDYVMRDAYSHEVASCGYWPGGSAEGLFYAYAYPERFGYHDRRIAPAQAFYDQDLHEFVLPYDEVRRRPDGETLLLEFFQSAYQAAAYAGAWNPALEIATH